MRIGNYGIVLILCSCLLTSCNTMRGFGTDIKKSGEYIEKIGK
jgi:predicted small secreted protein